MHKAHAYVECWEEMKAGNIGYLLWGMVGTGKSYFAGCIANALVEESILLANLVKDGKFHGLMM